MLYKKIAKPILFRMNPERAHLITLGAMKWAARVPGVLAASRAIMGTRAYPELATDLWGIRFQHVVGLAAGLDKDAEAVEGFASCGFAFVEVGTVTPKPQPGNERPRLFRLPEDRALINRMGFNNKGAKAMQDRLKRRGPFCIPVAVNIGKNKTTPNDEAAEDYRQCVRDLYAVGDFFVINISSPNTPGLRELQHGEELMRLLGAVREEVGKQSGSSRPVKPFLVKIAPDLSDEELDAIVDASIRAEVSGIIATNTTLSRAGLVSRHQQETGGLSGSPLQQRSTEVIRHIYRRTSGKLPIIGVGGIATGDDAYEKICAGATLVEIYTSLIYEGPGIIRSIQDRLVQRLREDGLSHISEAVGRDARVNT